MKQAFHLKAILFLSLVVFSTAGFYTLQYLMKILKAKVCMWTY